MLSKYVKIQDKVMKEYHMKNLQHNWQHHLFFWLSFGSFQHLSLDFTMFHLRTWKKNTPTAHSQVAGLQPAVYKTTEFPNKLP